MEKKYTWASMVCKDGESENGKLYDKQIKTCFVVCQVINFIKQILGNNESVRIDLVVINLIVGVRSQENLVIWLSVRVLWF